MGRPAILKIDILADAKGVGKGVNDADSALSRLGKGAGKVGLAVGAGLAGAAVAVGAFAVSSIGAASDVEQSFGAVESVFGKAAGQVKGYAASAATSLGLAKSEYAGLAAVVGSQLQGMGKSQADSAVETQKLIGMGADLAATFGGSVSDAVGAVGSLLRGERDPIEKYGVSITAADVAARLAATGQDKLTGAALKTAQANATLTLLTQKTANAHGAFSRESNTLAGQQERLKAQFENVKATVGGALTPALTALFSTIGTRVLPAAQQLGTELSAKLGPFLARVGEFVRTNVLPAMTTLSVYFTSTVRPALAQVGSFLSTVLLPAFAAVAGFVLTRVVPAVVQLAGPVLNGLRSALGSVQTAIVSNRENLTKIGTAVQAVIGVALKAAPVVGVVLGGAFRLVGGAISNVIGIIAAVVGVVDKAIAAIRRLANIAKTVGSVVGKLNPFGGSAVPLHSMGVPLVGGGPSLGPLRSGLTTAALGGSDLASLSLSGSYGSGVTVIDRRVIDARMTVTGAIDPPAVARQLEQLLRDHTVRLGRATAFGTA